MHGYNHKALTGPWDLQSPPKPVETNKLPVCNRTLALHALPLPSSNVGSLFLEMGIYPSVRTGWMDRLDRLNGWMDRLDGRTGQSDGQTDGWTGLTDLQTDKTDGQTNERSSWMDGLDRRMDSQTDGPNGQTDGRMDAETDWIDRQTDEQTGRTDRLDGWRRDG